MFRAKKSELRLLETFFRAVTGAACECVQKADGSLNFEVLSGDALALRARFGMALLEVSRLRQAIDSVPSGKDHSTADNN